AFQRRVGVVDVGLVVPGVVDFHRLRVDVRLERVVGVGELGEREGHRGLLAKGGWPPIVAARELKNDERRGPGPPPCGMPWPASDAVLESVVAADDADLGLWRSEEHTSELQSRENLVCRLLLEKKKNIR